MLKTLFQVDTMYNVILFQKEFNEREIKLFSFFPNCLAAFKLLTGPKQIDPTIVVSRINKFLLELLI